MRLTGRDWKQTYKRIRFWWLLLIVLCVGIATTMSWITKIPDNDPNVINKTFSKPVQQNLTVRYSGVWSKYTDVLSEEEALHGPNTKYLKKNKKYSKQMHQNLFDRYSGVWSPYTDVLPEEEALSGPNIKDSKKYVMGLNVTVQERKEQLMVGDDIYLNIEVYDFYSNVRSFGGDHIRIRMADKKNNAYSKGYVLDHGNGTYTGVLKALWSGDTTIITEIHYTREEITYLYELRRKTLSTRVFQVRYGDGYKEEISHCQPFPVNYGTHIGFCNFTHFNADVPWYCSAPVTTGLTCKHKLNFIKLFYNDEDLKKRLATKSWSETVFSHTIQLSIKDGHQSSLIKRPTSTCPESDRSQLWQQRSPIGHFFNGKWILENCVSARDTRDPECVRGKTLILFGDSTVLQWYNDLMKRFNCKHDRNRGRPCMNQNISLSIHMFRHSLPGNVHSLAKKVKNVYHSLESLVNLVSKESQPVFLIHIFTHYTGWHHSVYRQRIKLLRKSVDIIIDKRPDALILFKGPHTYRDKLRAVNDYYAFVYRTILIEEFYGIHDKIVYLDFKDMSIAESFYCTGVHPPDPFVSDMVDEMMAYVC